MIHIKAGTELEPYTEENEFIVHAARLRAMMSAAPPAVHSASAPHIRELDVRPIIAARGSPLGPILAALQALPPGGALRLIAPFEPVPLYAKLREMGFDHAARARTDDAWEILFTPRRANSPAPVRLDRSTLNRPNRCAAPSRRSRHCRPEGC